MKRAVRSITIILINMTQFHPVWRKLVLASLAILQHSASKLNRCSPVPFIDVMSVHFIVVYVIIYHDLNDSPITVKNIMKVRALVYLYQ